MRNNLRQPNSPVLFGGGGGTPNIVADVWLDMELAALDLTNLDAHDHYAPTGSWTINNGAGTPMSFGASPKALLSTIGGSADSPDVSGLRYNCNFSGIGGFLDFGFTGAKLDVSFGFWHRFPVGFNGSFTEHDILTVATQLGNKNIYIKLADGNVGSNIQSIHIFNPVDSYSAGIVVATNTWYWVNVIYNNNIAGTGMKLRVYDQTGVQVGVENSRGTVADLGCIHCQWGSLIGGNPFIGNLEFDDLVIDWTNHVFPFGP